MSGKKITPTKQSKDSSPVPKQGTPAYTRWVNEQIEQLYLECDLPGTETAS